MIKTAPRTPQQNRLTNLHFSSALIIFAIPLNVILIQCLRIPLHSDTFGGNPLMRSQRSGILFCAALSPAQCKDDRGNAKTQKKRRYPATYQDAINIGCFLAHLFLHFQKVFCVKLCLMFHGSAHPWKAESP